MRPIIGREHALICTRSGELQQTTRNHLRRGPLPLVLAQRTPYRRKMGKLTLEPDKMAATNNLERYSAPPPAETSSPWKILAHTHRATHEGMKLSRSKEPRKEAQNDKIGPRDRRSPYPQIRTPSHLSNHQSGTSRKVTAESAAAARSKRMRFSPGARGGGGTRPSCGPSRSISTTSSLQEGGVGMGIDIRGFKGCQHWSRRADEA